MATDWHPSDIKAAIEKRGCKLADVGRMANIDRRLISCALGSPHSQAEKAIARFLGAPPHQIWPSRYHADGRRKRPQPTENYRRAPRFRKLEAPAC